jgi:hypothetical protein
MDAKLLYRLFIVALLIGLTGSIKAEEITVGTSLDLYSRYVWRGLDIAATPSIQPALAVGYQGFELGTWGAYTLSNETSESDEIDFWLAYTHNLESGVSFSAIITDYYFPNAGAGFFSFEDYDAIREIVSDGGDPPTVDTLYGGAHTLEAGLSFTGSESFPVTLSGYINFHNDAGSNAYFQVDYPFAVKETELGLFVGATSGSKDNPNYYGTDDFQVINLGISAVREIKVSESFAPQLNVSLIVNPNAELSHLIVGISL